MPDLIQTFLERLVSPELQKPLLIIKIVLGGLGIFFLGFIILIVHRTSWVRFAFVWDILEFLTFRPYGLRRMTQKWRKIKERMESPNESEWKLVLIEADSMLDESLKRMGFRGEGMDDRIKTIAPTIVSNIQDVMEAHQVRNNIVHDPDYRLTLDKARKAFDAYEKAFRELDLI